MHASASLEKAGAKIRRNQNMEHLIVFCEIDEQLIGIPENVEEYMILNSQEENIGVRFEQYARKLFSRIKNLLMDKKHSRILIQLMTSGEAEKKVFSGLAGMLKTAAIEKPQILYQMILLSKITESTDVMEIIEYEQTQLQDKEIKYENGERYVKVLEETRFEEGDVEQDDTLPWKQNGVYWITGGAGGLGFLFAKEIASQVPNVTLVLTGRRAEDEEIRRKLEEVRITGANVSYIKGDIGSSEETRAIVADIQEKYGELTGILHCAGITRDNYIIRKTEEEFMTVLKPKVSGLVNLDEATKTMDMDFLLLFSSQSAEEGNAGQADYATGNAFMDAYAQYRNELVQTGQRHGQTISINWPLWKEGGMHVSDEVEKSMLETRGIIPLTTRSGLFSLFQAFDKNMEQVMVLEGDAGKITAKPASDPSVLSSVSHKTEENEGNDGVIKEKFENYLKKLISDKIKLSVERIKTKEHFEAYGIDSVMIMDMTSSLEKDFGKLSKTLFFEYSNIEELSIYFIENYKDTLTKIFGLQELNDRKAEESTEEIVEEKTEEEPVLDTLKFLKEEPDKDTKGKDEPIAIIGLSGRYPQAENMDEFWKNLCQGKDCITEIPEERWDYHLYYNDDGVKAGKVNSKWGGFLNDVDKFDPLFFHISYDETLGMDPQERLFLECAYETLEDAGYTLDTLRTFNGEGMEGNVGVFAGVMYSEYQLYGAQEQARGNMVALNGITSSIANRVSYTFNLHGPSVSVNTMCSSSLLAVHLACQSIQNGECEMALAGGVNLSIHPNKYLMLSHNNFMSSKGRCESFGKDGDGYVPGEGVGAVLLKPLSKAIKDKDHIYAVVKGSAVNHGGKTNGFTVPNPNAQADVIRRALKKADICATDVSYIEAHGTGTSLGDPIEINALARVFSEDTDKKEYCSIGSVKSNIGHLESAAGIASITKVLLQMKYGKLVPSIHSRVLNPYIDFEDTPFKVQQEYEDWDCKGGIRRAGISAFGAGGTNVHLLLEEYKQPEHNENVENQEYAVILSGKTRQALDQSIERLLKEIEKGTYNESDLRSIAYTLQFGRQALDYRFAAIVSSLEELRNTLQAYKNGQSEIENAYVGNVKTGRETLSAVYGDQDIKTMSDTCIEKGKIGKLLYLWVNGEDIDWKAFYQNGVPEKISLPTYPFAKERIWIPTTDEMPIPMGKQTKVLKQVAEENLVSNIEKEKEADWQHITKEQLQEKTLFYLKEVFAQVSKIPLDKVEEDVDFEEYGMDSIRIGNLTARMKQEFPSIQATIFFECHDLLSLADCLMEHYEDCLVELFYGKTEEVCQEMVEKKQKTYREEWTDSSSCQEFAIIGMSGRYPGAETTEEYWNNLKEGKDCVTEIPPERWNYKDFYDKEKGKRGKLYGKWGGFIQDADKFDPLFFNMSPDYAEAVDPQERLFLQSVYETIEDAGYTRKSLGRYMDLGLEGSVGVFVGVTFMEYQFYGVQNQALGKNIAVTGLPSSIANHVSYFFNFHGPSIAVDTMCSSSLTALNLACESIRNGECQVAIAGGVNLSLHPNKYLFLSQNYFLSTKGRCESFSNSGDGYVPGEGVVSVMLKPLSQAEKDGDHIYGVITSTAVNHGGKTNGYTVPNLNAQRQVVRKALEKSKIPARAVSYMEAHGTGTSLGDPIEIAGLTSAFEADTTDKGFCSIGSVKSNIGHLEAASGLAGLTKILLQMKYKTLVPSIHADVLNEKITFEETPFYVQQKLQEWKRPVIEMNGEKKEFPRIAGLSSFGAGGSNAHVLIREYEPEQTDSSEEQKTETSIIILSAKTKERLYEVVKRLYNALLIQKQEADLLSISYTLQVGREPMEERFGFLAGSMEEVLEKLSTYLEGKESKDSMHGRAMKRKANEWKKEVEQCLEDNHKLSLLKLWVEGCEVDWEKLYENRTKPHRISLPAYPFERIHCWLEEFQYDAVKALKNEASPMNSLSGEDAVDVQPMENGRDPFVWKTVWEEVRDVKENAKKKKYKKHVAILCGGSKMCQEIAREQDIKVLESQSIELSGQYIHYGVQLRKKIKKIGKKYPDKRVLVQVVVLAKEETGRGLASILHTVVSQYGQMEYQLIQIQNEAEFTHIADYLKACRNTAGEREILYSEGKRYVKRLERLAVIPENLPDVNPWKEHGVYLMVGETGLQETALAEEIAKSVKHANIVICGKKYYDIAEKIQYAKEHEIAFSYYDIDITDRQQVKSCMKKIEGQYGQVNGLIYFHSIDKKENTASTRKKEFEAALRKKLEPASYFDKYSKDMDLDFMLLVSYGSLQSDKAVRMRYDLAEEYFEQFAQCRNRLVSQKERSGFTFALCLTNTMQCERSREYPVFTQILALKKEQTVVGFGKADMQTKSSSIGEESEADDDALKEKVLGKLLAFLEKEFKISPGRLDAEEEFEAYGIDSIKGMRIVGKLRNDFRNITIENLLESSTIKEFSENLVIQFKEECQKWVRKEI